MKTLLKIINPIVLASLVLISGFIQCDSADDDNPVYFLMIDGNGYSSFNLQTLRNRINALPHEPLNDPEEQSLLFMREEEKLARDLYTKFYALWDHTIFGNIAESEQTHMDAVKVLLDKYQLVDPAAHTDYGEFTNVTLQDMYDEFVATGSKTLADALTVGAMVEETDIIDLTQALEEVVDNQDITLVYQNLRDASKNHLRAFVKVLDRNGITYEPRYLSEETYNIIINSSFDRGRPF